MTALKSTHHRKRFFSIYRWIALAAYVLISLVSHGQAAATEKDSCNLRISLLTCTPGQELYSIFGHTAIRVTNAQNDWVFNYGTFNFNDPAFYSKFVRGKLSYFLSVETFADFVYAYQWEQRGITEQVLSLDCKEKKKLFERLIANAQVANRYYKYDFLFDNCTTRAGDMIRKNNSQQFFTKNIMQGTLPSFRQLLHDYLDNGGLVWSKLGIDILLGSRIDRRVNNYEYQFLPDNLMAGIDSTTADGTPIVKSKSVLLQKEWKSSGTPIDPAWWFLLISLIVAIPSYFQRNNYTRWQQIFDHFFFSTLGLLGCLLTFMWWGTDHASCRDNFNLLWCLPVNLFYIWLPNKFRGSQKKYFWFQAVVYVVLIAGWLLLPQQLNIALLPILFLAAMRSWILSKR